MPSQELILKYLSQQSLTLSNNSTKEDREMFLYLEDTWLMAVYRPGVLQISNAGNDFIRNYGRFGRVPDGRSEWITNIISQLKSKDVILDGWGNEYKKVLNELRDGGIIKAVGVSNVDSLTPKADRFINSGMTYDDFLNSEHRTSLISNTYNNTVEKGNIYQDFSRDNSLHKAITTINTPQTNSKPPTMEKWQLWVAVIVGIATILGTLKTCGYI